MGLRDTAAVTVLEPDTRGPGPKSWKRDRALDITIGASYRGAMARAVMLLALAIACGGCTFLRIVRHGPSDIDDFKVFDHRELPPAAEPFHFVDQREPRRIPRTLRVRGLGKIGLEDYLARSKTVAFVVVQGDALLYQRAFGDRTPDTKVQIFSVSKSIQSLLVGAAIRERRIRAIEQPITDFVPELAPRGFSAVTLEHLLDMTSGSSYVESDNPFGRHPALYYGTDMTPDLLDLDLEAQPGQRWRYKSGDSQLVGLALARALAPETITDFARRVLWEPLGMEHEGSWAIDHPGGLEKTFCCLSMRAIDLAKIGAMVASQGRWRGKEIIPAAWIARATTPRADAGSAPFYRLGWWIPPELEGGFMGSGHLGQYLIVLPRSRLVVVRLGERGDGRTQAELIRLTLALEEELRARAP